MHRRRSPKIAASRLSMAFLMVAALTALSACENLGSNPRADTIVDIFVPTTPAEAARWAIDPYDTDKRQRGILLLANAPFGGERVYVQLYEVATEDEDPTVRSVAVRALALHGEPSHVPLIAARLSDEDPVVRREAARALQRLHNPAAVEPLIRATDARNEKDTDTRVYAARALGQYAEPRVVQALIGALSDRRLAVNRSALVSLRVLTGQDFGFISRQWLDWTGSASNLFANRGLYVYPVFRRDPTIVELLVPFWGPPNETPDQLPVGMAADTEIEADGTAALRSGG